MLSSITLNAEINNLACIDTRITGRVSSLVNSKPYQTSDGAFLAEILNR